VCQKLDAPLPGSSLTDWLSWSKIIRLISSLPPF
jgi:hypothetical protein